MPIHFYREGEGSSLDQPLLWQVYRQPALGGGFAAVLGSPVEHSRSPMEQRTYFASRGMPFVAVELDEGEFADGLRVLSELGLRAAAVTSPLKRAAFSICGERSAEAESAGSVNTLIRAGNKWRGHNTDTLALHGVRGELPDFSRVWLWGGGGVKASVKSAWPNAIEISARAGTQETVSPDLLIWATNRSRPFKWPPSTACPSLVLDLNYGEDSPGLEWACDQGLSYKSGLRMFELQAAAQREYWEQHLS